MDEWLTNMMLNFCEENWVAFLENVKGLEVPEEDIEEAINKYKEERGLI